MTTPARLVYATLGALFILLTTGAILARLAA